MTRPATTVAAAIAAVGALACLISAPQVAWLATASHLAWRDTAWLYPLLVDVLLALTSVLIVLRRDDPALRRTAWTVLVVCALFSGLANVLHSARTADPLWPAPWGLVVSLSAAVFPTFVVVTAPHLGVLALRRAEPAQAGAPTTGPGTEIAHTITVPADYLQTIDGDRAAMGLAPVSDPPADVTRSTPQADLDADDWEPSIGQVCACGTPLAACVAEGGSCCARCYHPTSDPGGAGEPQPAPIPAGEPVSPALHVVHETDEPGSEPSGIEEAGWVAYREFRQQGIEPSSRQVHGLAAAGSLSQHKRYMAAHRGRWAREHGDTGTSATQP